MADIYYDVYEEGRWIAGEVFDETDTTRIQTFLSRYPETEDYSIRVSPIPAATTATAASAAAGAGSIETTGGNFIWTLGGQYLLDPNEMNGWRERGAFDDTFSTDLDNVGDTNPIRLSGGLCFPFDVKIKRFFAWHRISNSTAEAWGWVIYQQQKTNNSTSVTSQFILDEVGDNGGAGPNDYNNTNNQLTDIDLSEAANNVLLAGDVLTLGVAAPTAQTTNRYVQVMSGYLEFERIN